MANKTVPVVRNCARCGGNHSEVVFLEFSQPIQIRMGAEKQDLTHWAMCPRCVQPMLAVVTEKDGVSIEHYHPHEHMHEAVSDGEGQEDNQEGDPEEGSVPEEPSTEASEKR